jgi:4-amino-4-deoxy-L-arabinose transferase-like glycosyltransferase
MALNSALDRIVQASWFWPLVVAVCAWVVIVAALDPVGDHPRSFAGPGFTVDEGFNVGQGAALADRLLAFDLAGFRRVDAQLPDHPPLGRLAIGLCHELAFLVWPPVDTKVAYSVTCARTAPATAFAVLVFLVGTCCGRWYGRCGGLGAALAVVLMPRLFGHAHLAALETMVNLTTAGAVLFLAARFTAVPHDPSGSGGANRQVPEKNWTHLVRTATICGLLFGLALLTKVQAVLLPIPVIAWALWHWRLRGLTMMAAWGLTGLAVFLVFWPHLWNAPIDHLREYLGRTTDRAVLLVWYFGREIADRDVPWHYPWLMFLATVPVGLHALGACGLFGPAGPAWKSPREQLVLACILFPLCVFSFPGVAVYDGERLFSFVFPLWAVMIGRGAAAVAQWACSRFSSRATICGMVLFLAAQSYGLWALAPCWLSYYNLAVGGLAGATRMGLEPSYWGDSVTRDLLAEAAERVPAGGTVAVLPTLHPAQWNEIRLQCPPLKARDIQLAPWGTKTATHAEYLLMFMRPEYLPEEFRGRLDEKRIVAAVRRQGVFLAVLLDRRWATDSDNSHR